MCENVNKGRIYTVKFESSEKTKEEEIIMNKLKNTKGITLIALVITIIVLLILAGITIAQIAGQDSAPEKAAQARIENDKGAVRDAAAMLITEKIQDYYNGKYVNSSSDAQYAGTILAYLESELAASKNVTREGCQIVVADGTITATKTGESEAFVEGTVSPEGVISWGTAGGGNTTNTAYTMGDTVTLGGEEFWVIEDSDANTETVKLLAKLCVKTTSGEGQYTQTASANTLAFDSTSPYSNVYADSTIKTEVENYKTAVEGRMGAGKTIQEARLMTGTAEGTWDSSYTTWTYTSGTGEVGALLDANKTDIVYGPSGAKLNYWLGSPNVSYSNREWLVYGVDSNVGYGGVYYDNVYGLRPVLVVLKSNI